ncbi:hypothetical protein [Bradyrhizobium sp. CCBAU 11386]|uniref:hypothetical protein n=1 Tax=Bradyrhizobium sp. CCBAU 11386 TaxID=1630837 RepID=UPI00230384C8|nr:hypothetical protein [Bradyrhizobium sp. CCBAU 11386]
MHRNRMPLEELAVDFLFETFGEHRYNRSPQQYEYLASLVPPLKQAYHRVNERLKGLLNAAQTKRVLLLREIRNPRLTAGPTRLRR